MLLQFVVENNRSFQQKTVLSMIASSDEAHPGHVCALADGTRVLRCALLYGANASGKSNLVRSLYDVVALVTDGVRPGGRANLRPFRPGEASAPVRFEFAVMLDQTRYDYGLVYQPWQQGQAGRPGRVEEEWLYLTSEGHEHMCFERTLAPGAAKAEICLGEVGEPADRVNFVAQGTRAEQPFLTEADERDVVLVKPLMRWLREGLVVVEPNAPYRDLAIRAEQDAGLMAFLTQTLREAGTGVDDLDVKTEMIPRPKNVSSELDSETLGTLLRDFAESGRAVRMSQGADVFELVRLVTRHTLPGGRSVEFELSDESDGTRRLLHLAPALHRLHQQRDTFVIDELDRSLHPLLTRWFLQKFLTSDPARTSGQLICTTHDTGLMDVALLRPDEIWFVEKDAAHSSRLYSLAEFKRDQLARIGAIENGYLHGRFGAIPFLGTARQLGREE